MKPYEEESFLNERDIKEYEERHQKEQQAFLHDVKELLHKHHRMLYEEQYYGVIYDSPLSQKVVSSDQLKRYVEQSYPIDMYGLFCYLADALNMPIPSDFLPPKEEKE